VDAAAIVAATLSKLAREGVVKPKIAEKALAELGVNTEWSGAARA
jgi:pyruvate dehydrogenase E1 component